MTTNMSFKTRCKPYMVQRQQGAVLVIGMILLLVLTIAGVSMMSSTTQDEKLSGNTKRSGDAFMAAEAGVKATENHLCLEHRPGDELGIKYVCDGDDKEEASNPPEWFFYKCEDRDDDDDYELIDPANNIVAADVSILGVTQHAPSGSIFSVRYTDEDGDGEADCEPKAMPDPDNPGSELTLKSVRVMSFSSDGNQTASMRRIHFNLGHIGAGGEASWPAIFVNDNPNSPQCNFDFGPSNSYLYDGRGGPAISTNTEECAEQIRGADSGNGQLKGGVIANNPAPEFTSPAGLERFFAVLDTETPDGRKVRGQPDKNPNKNMVVNKQALPHDLGTPGDPSSMQTTIVYGDLNITGGLTGAGILVVTGKANFGGTPHWDGIIIVLGGEVDIGGGGAANGLDGTLILTHIDFEGSDQDGDGYLDEGLWNKGGNDEWDYTSSNWEPRWKYDAVDPAINWDVSGGGNALYNYGCQNLIDAAENLESIMPSVAELPDDVPSLNFPAPQECPANVGDGDGDGEGLVGSFGRLTVFNWLEEVGE